MGACIHERQTTVGARQRKRRDRHLSIRETSEENKEVHFELMINALKKTSALTKTKNESIYNELVHNESVHKNSERSEL